MSPLEEEGVPSSVVLLGKGAPMKIVVLAGGLSPERNVSLSSGTMIAHALRGLGHQAALVDMYFGLEAYTGPVADYFDAPLTDQWKQVDPKAPDLAEIRAARKWQSPSPPPPGPRRAGATPRL